MYKEKKIYYINKKISIIRDKKVIIWGAGEHTKRLFELTEIGKYNIENIVDIDISKQGTELFGINIVRPDAIKWANIDIVIISIMYTDISIKLKEYGFGGNIIQFYDSLDEFPFYLLQNEENKEENGGYFGRYNNWEEVLEVCEGYDDKKILNKVIEATKAVLNGEAKWERDTKLFYEEKYNYRICAFILKCALENHKRKLSILDIGGALGSTYFQNRNFLENVDLQWIITEQEHFAEYGRCNIENKNIKFINSEDDYSVYGKIDVVIVSGSLQYIQNYKDIVKRILDINPRYIIIDRILVSKQERICKQVIPRKIYEGSYPVRIFNELELDNIFGNNYEIVEKDVASVPGEVYWCTQKAVYRMYVYRNMNR